MAKWNTPEDKNINYFETRYMYEERQKVYIANEETNQVWDETDVPDVIRGWNNNWSTTEIAEYLGADRKEIELLLLDLIHQGKIHGNIHIFKPKRKVKTLVINMGEHPIRIIHNDRRTWLCLKDIWEWIGKPEHSYRKVTENWGPDHRAKFQLDTPGGRQRFIFINTQGLDKLFHHVETNQIKLLQELKGAMGDGMGISSAAKTTTQKGKEK